MALELKKRSKLFLKNQKVNVEESSSAPESFGIANLPDFLGEGKNTFKIKPGTGYLKSGTEIQIEILDVNGNPIYWETSTYKDSDNSRLVSIWVYNLPTNVKYDTPDGRAELIVVGTLKSGGTIRWTRKINVIKSRQSPSNIVFDKTPKANISSSVDTFTNKQVSNNELIKTSNTTTAYYKKSVFGDTVSIERVSGDSFNQEMVGGVIQTNFTSTTLYPILGGGQSQPTDFTSSITEVVSSNILRIGTTLTSSDSRHADSYHTYEYSNDPVSFDIQYYSTGSDTNTQNQTAFANITLLNVNPIGGRVYSVRTSIKSEGLSNSEYSVIGETRVDNTSSISYKVPIPTEQLNDPKTLRIQFVNELGSVSTTEVITNGLVFTGGNVYIAGDQSLISGSFHIGNTIGTGIEMAGHSSGYLKSVGYKGMTSASLGKGPGGFIIWSGSGNLQVGVDQYPGVGMEMVSAGGSSSFYFTTHDGGNLKVITDEFFIGTEDTQYISGSNGNIEISSSFFHLDPKNSRNIIGGFVVTPTAISSSQTITGLGTPLALKSNGDITGSNVLIRQRISGTNYTLLDTAVGVIDARNVGRQIVSDTTEYYVNHTGTSYTDVASYIFTLLPEETHIGISYNALALVGGATSAAPYVRFRIESSSYGTSRGAGPYDNYDSPFGGGKTITTDAWSGAVAGTYDSSSRSQTPQLVTPITIPGSFNGHMCRVTVSLRLSAAGSYNSDTKLKIKNLSMITTKAFSAEFADAVFTTPDPPVNS